MKLYVANATKQNHDFQYWLPDAQRPYTRQIPIGQQILIESDTVALERIVEQHILYGITDINDVVRGTQFHGIVFSFDKPINLERLIGAMDMHDQAITDRALEQRKRSAAAVNETLMQAAAESGAQLQHSEVEIVEQQKRQGDTEQKFQQTISVDKAPGENSRPTRQSRRKAA